MTTGQPRRQVRTRTRPALTAVPTADDILAAALAYASAGERVIPLDDNRTPFLTEFQDIATRGPDTLRLLFADPRTCGVGIMTDQLIVLDVDGEPGERSLRELEERLGPLPPTRTIRTPSGGRHLHFDCARPVRLLTHLEPALEIKALSQDGNPVCVPMPPTWRRAQDGSGGVYRFLDDRPPELLPEAWLAEIAERIAQREARRASRQVAAADTGRAPDRFEREQAERVLEERCAEIAAARTGRRNLLNDGALIVGHYLRFLDEAEATRRLIAAGRASLWPGDIETTVRNALHDGAAEPWDFPRSTLEFRGPPPLPPPDDHVPERAVSPAPDGEPIRTRVAVTPALPPDLLSMEGRPMSEVQVTPVVYAVPHFVPFAMATLLGGHPGTGKSI